ncbi:MAG: hypothetical protein KAV00_07120 [Phycisphaerae bacterium]|nr:hypothetical protein [Phycisphaerae bacterium]
MDKITLEIIKEIDRQMKEDDDPGPLGAIVAIVLTGVVGILLIVAAAITVAMMIGEYG